MRDTGAVVEGGRRPKSPWREKWAGAHAHYMSFRSSSAADRGRSFCPRFSAFFCRLVLRVGGGRLRHSTGKHKSRWPRARTGGGGRPPGPAWCRRRGSGPVVRGGAVRFSGGTDGAGRKAGMGRGTLSTLISLLDRCQQPSTGFEPPNGLAENVVLRCDKSCEGSTSRYLRRQGCLVTQDVAVLPLSRCS